MTLYDSTRDWYPSAVLGAFWTVTIALALQASPAPRRAPTPAELARAWPDDKPISRLPQNLVSDLAAMPTVRSLEITAAGTAASLLLHQVDDEAADRALDAKPTSYAVIGDVLGDGWVQGGAAVGAYILGRSIHHAELTHIGSDLTRAQILNGVLTGVIKIAVDRDRPNGGSHSFPSGHTSATFATAAVMQAHYGWKVGLPSYAFGGFVAWCRVRSRAHWVSDTAAGATIGIVVGQTIAAGHRQRTWQVLPAKTSGGFAVYVVRVK